MRTKEEIQKRLESALAAAEELNDYINCCVVCGGVVGNNTIEMLTSIEKEIDVLKWMLWEPPVEIKNPSFYCYDDGTFCFNFDGGVDEDGDEFYYCCEYQPNIKKYLFERVYDFDVTPTEFSEEQKQFIIKQMDSIMRDKNYV